MKPSTVALTLAFGAFLGFIVTAAVMGPRAEAAPTPDCKIEAPIPPTVDPQIWLYRGLDACESKCGPVPFEAEVEPQRLKCSCGRPGKIAR